LREPESLLMKLSYFLLFSIVRLIVLIAAFIPHKLCLSLGGGLGRIAFCLMKTRRQVAIDNLKLVYGESLSLQACVQLARKNFAHLGAALLEIIHFVGCPGRSKKKIQIKGQEHLHAALRQNKGVVLFSAHIGNFILMPAAIAQLADVKFLFRDPTNINVSRIYRWMIGRLGIQVIADNPRHLCAFHSFSHLRSGGILGILIDQVETGGIYVDFMGHPAGSTLGAANMALKSGAPLLPVHCVRLRDQSLFIEIEAEFQIRRQGEPGQLITEAVAGMNKVVEAWVRKNPEQWFWGHRRWRSWRK